MLDLPIEFRQRMESLLAEEYGDFLKSYETDNYRSLRVNTLKGSVVRFLALYKDTFSLEQVPWCETGFYYDESSRPGRTPLPHAGAIYIQEASAMVPVEAGDVGKGMKVMDLCAAPGGKSTQILSKLMGTGLLVSNEIVSSRARILAGNLERMGAANAVVLNESPQKLENVFPDFFDRVFVDAPCSGEGMFRKDETALREWSPDRVRACAVRQDHILDSARKMVSPGGLLIYSTCTFSIEEDEGSVSRFLERHPDFCIEQCPLSHFFEKGIRTDAITCEGIENTMRLFPHRIAGEGHYVAVLKREDGSRARVRMHAFSKDKKKIALFERFRKEYMPDRQFENVVTVGDRIVRVPEGLPDLDKVKVLSFGLGLGEVKKDRFEPLHSLAMALRPEEFSNCEQLDMESEETLEYLTGMEIKPKTAKKGYCLVCVDGYSTGFGKCDGNTIKNHYPKGLRITR